MSLLPEVERELLDAARRTSSLRPARQAESRRARPSDRTPRRRVLAAAGATGAVVVAVLMTFALTGTRAGGGVDVAVAAYRAISHSGDVTHAMIEITTTDATGRRPGRPVRVETWARLNPGQARTVQRSGRYIFEQAISGHRATTWTSGRPHVITTTTVSRVIGRPRDPIGELRAMYRSGRVRVLAKGRLDGRSVWHLRIGGAIPSSGPRLPAADVVVDALTFAPIRWTGYAAVATSQAGPYKIIGRTVTRYLKIERLPATASNRALLLASEPHTAEGGESAWFVGIGVVAPVSLPTRMQAVGACCRARLALRPLPGAMGRRLPWPPSRAYSPIM